MLEPVPELEPLVAVAGAGDAEVALSARRLLAVALGRGEHPVAPLGLRHALALLQGPFAALVFGVCETEGVVKGDSVLLVTCRASSVVSRTARCLARANG